MAAGIDDSGDRARQVELTENDLPLHCPLPGAPLWSRHPRVFLDVTKEGAALCPYCGTRYIYKGITKSH
jgi:uncharacterized Zn-finger protein